jgi:hypothetical protein
VVSAWKPVPTSSTRAFWIGRPVAALTTVPVMVA